MTVSIQRTLAALAVAACLLEPRLIVILGRKSLQYFPERITISTLDAAQPLNAADSQRLLAAIADGLSKEFGLLVVDSFPRNQTDGFLGEIGALRYNSSVPPECLTRSRYTGLAQPQSSAYLPTNDTVAVYIDGAEIIYLIEGLELDERPKMNRPGARNGASRTSSDLSMSALRTAKSSHMRHRIVGCTSSARALNWILNLMAFRYSAKRNAFTDCASARAHRNSPTRAA